MALNGLITKSVVGVAVKVNLWLMSMLDKYECWPLLIVHTLLYFV